MSDGTEKLFVRAAVEGVTDAAVVRRLVDHVGGHILSVHGQKGKPYLRENIRGYSNAAYNMPWIVLVDLDMDADCPVTFRNKWLPEPAPDLCFRIAVREVEAWLLADADSLAHYLEVPRTRIPRDPEGREDPKGDIVGLARRSRRREVREDMALRSGSSRQVGPAYAGRLIDYAETVWRPDVAARHSDSLQRTIECLRRLIAVRGKTVA